jgi:type II secretory pathway pseudopilin PulG
MLCEKVFVIVIIGILSLATLTSGSEVCGKAREVENLRPSVEQLFEEYGG